MVEPIKVLLADDSITVQKLLTATLSIQTDLQIVGAAKNGREVLDLIPTTRPDLILLDIKMPVMDGIDALRHIRQSGLKTPIIMFSSLTVCGAEATLDALALGANDYIAKPTAAGHVQQAIDYITDQVVPRVKYWGRSREAARPDAVTNSVAPPNASPPAGSKNPGAVDVVAIGSSTGGPNALAEIIPKLPASLSVPILISQHMPAVFTRLLAERLQRKSALRVREAEDGAVLRAGDVWIAPGDFHMTIQRKGTDRVISLNQQPPENSCRPSVDVMMRSVADVFGHRALALILTGMGKDGASGCTAVKKRGGFVIAQDRTSCVVWGMPRAVEEAGMADRIVSLSNIHVNIANCVRNSGKELPVPVG